MKGDFVKVCIGQGRGLFMTSLMAEMELSRVIVAVAFFSLSRICGRVIQNVFNCFFDNVRLFKAYDVSTDFYFPWRVLSPLFESSFICRLKHHSRI
jgi:hypothetical protein